MMRSLHDTADAPSMLSQWLIFLILILGHRVSHP